MVGSRSEIAVCFAISKYPPRFGGQGIQIQRLLPFLRERGIHPEVLTSAPRSGDPPRSPGDEDHVHRLLPDDGGRSRRARRVLAFRRHITRNARRYDLLHASLMNWEVMLNLRHVKRCGLPVIMETVILGKDDPLAVSRERFGRWKARLLKQVDAWVGITDAFRARAIAAGIPEERFHMIHGGVDVERYRPMSGEERRAARTRHGIPLDARVVVSAGSVIRRKGMDRVVKAWAKLRPQEGRDLLAIVGPVSAEEGLPPAELQHVSEIRTFLRSAGVEGTVRFVGFSDALDEYFGLADLFLFLSRREGMGYVTAEALACGLPCVVSELDGIGEELIEENRTGHVIHDADDPERVAATVSRVLQDPATWERMSREARDSAVRRFSFQQRADALSSLYRQILDRPPGGPGDA